MSIRVYSLPCNQIGRAIVTHLIQNPNVKILKLSARPHYLQVTVTEGYQTVERVMIRFGLR